QYQQDGIWLRDGSSSQQQGRCLKKFQLVSWMNPHKCCKLIFSTRWHPQLVY
ncbi:unnamed protein product, partial [Musa acuminata subsp. burmannicoides]